MDKQSVEAALLNDPFYDPEDTHLDLSDGPKHLMTEDQPELVPEVVTNLPEVELPEEVDPVAAAPQPDPEPEPQTYQYDDGSSVTIEKTKKGWKAICDSNTGANPEVFYGATKDELVLNIAAGKINATKKIRELNRRNKLDSAPAPVVRPEPPRQRTREITADDVFTIKSQLEDNPVQGLDTAIQKKTGFTLDQLASYAERGYRAGLEQEREAIGMAFVNATPEYYRVDQNYWSIAKWLAKFKLGQVMTRQNERALLDELSANDLYTVENLTEAFEDLKDSGLIVFAPEVEEEVEEEAETPTPAPKQVAPKVPETRTRPRGGLGIRNPQTATRPAASQPEKKLEELTQSEQDELLAGIRKLKAENPALYEKLKAEGEAKRRR